MCEMCDKFKTCVACEYGGCEEHRAVEELAKPVNDSSVTAGTDRAVDAMKEVKNWFTDNYNDSTKVGIDPADDDGSNLDPNMYPNSDTTGGTTGGSQIRDNMFELLRDTIAAVPQKYWSRLGIGYTIMSGQSFPEACALHGADAPVSLGPQGEPIFRFDLDQPRDPDGKFAGGEASGASAQSPEFEKQETKIEGDVKTTKYVSPNHSIIVEHNTKEGKVTVKHLDKNGDLLVQQTHDSIGAARKELQTQGIDHKFYAARSFGIQPIFGPQGEILLVRYSPDQPREQRSGWITIKGAHVFLNDDGVIEKGPAEFKGKRVEDITQTVHEKWLASLTPAQKSEMHALAKSWVYEKAQKLAGVKTKAEKRYSEDQPRDDHGRFAAGGGSAEEKPDEVKQVEALQAKMYEIESKAAALETSNPLNGAKTTDAEHNEFWERVRVYHEQLEGLNKEHDALLKQIQELKSTNSYKEWAAKDAQRQAAANREEVEKTVERVAKEQNYERVQVLTKEEGAYPNGFSVGGSQFDANGYADLTSGMITIISNVNHPDQVPGVMAHEIEHERFQGALNAYNYEHQALMKLPTDELFGAQGAHGVGVLRPDGSVRPEAEGRFPVTTLLQKSLEQDKFKLYDSDGCTKYSEAYWKHYVDNGRRSADGERAMHETLAEMARIKVTTGKFPEGSNTGWRDLYRAVDKVAKSGNALWPNGRTPGYYVTGEN